ncbi:MAG: DUF4168 domain-containing protein [Desulfovermiculus sp.]
MHRSIFLPVVLFTFGLILSLGSSLALAEKAHDDVFETEINEETEMEAEDIDREDLRNFIQASNKVQDIRKEYTEEIQKDGDVSELRREAVEKMEEAIQDSDLDVEEYRGIGYHVQQDDELLEDFK